MTSMKHKSADAKRARRTRYKRAIEPVKQMFNCTSMEVSGLVQHAIRENEQLKDLLKTREHQLREYIKEKADLQKQIDSLKADLHAAKNPE